MNKKQWTLAGVLLVAFVLAGTVVYPLLRASINASKQLGIIQQLETEMQKPAMYLPVANDFALYCHAIGGEINAQSGMPFEKEWLPDSVQRMPIEYCVINSDSANITCGGGFYHYGYFLKKDAGETPDGDSVWRLYLRREDRPDLELTSVHLPKSARFPVSDFIARTLRHYSESIARKPNDLGLYQQQLMFCLIFASRDEAIKNLRSAIKTMSDSWWLRFTSEFLAVPSGTSSRQGLFKSWVDANPSLSNYGYLAWLDRLEGKSKEAEEAAGQMLNFAPSGDSVDKYNVYLRALSLASYCAQHGNYDLALRIFNKTDPIVENADEYSKREYLMDYEYLRDACKNRDKATVDSIAAKRGNEWIEHILGFEIFKAIRDSKPSR